MYLKEPFYLLSKSSLLKILPFSKAEYSGSFARVLNLGCKASLKFESHYWPLVDPEGVQGIRFKCGSVADLG